jgi:3-phosphoshikimate 1-carboxyvinyltransferase
MPLPELIEIVPLDAPVHADVTVPGSKSITNRALILAALADGRVTLPGALWSEDTQVTVECLQRLGFEVDVQPDPHEPCNRTISVRGLGGSIPQAGTREAPLDLFVGNAGTAARFLAAMVCLGRGWYRLHGVPRMHERPQAALFQALRHLGFVVESGNGNDRLPVRISGGSRSHPFKTECAVSIGESSQFASALLLSSKAGGWSVSTVGDNAEESPYVAMTSRMIEAFPHQGGVFQIEPDASSGSYFWAADHLLPGSRIAVNHWPASGWQIDAGFPRFLPLPGTVSRSRQLGDSIMTAIVLAPFAAHTVLFTDLGRLRVQECERVAALRTELLKCGAEVVEAGDTLSVSPSRLHGAEIETYNDHRMAMCFAILGLKVPGIKIQNPACVKKTFPNFFQKLAAPPPCGPGVAVLDARDGRRLSGDALFAG